MVIDPAAVLVLLDAINRGVSPDARRTRAAVDSARRTAGSIAKRLGLVEDRYVFALQGGGTVTLTMDELSTMSPLERQRRIGDHKRTRLALTEAGRWALDTRTVDGVKVVDRAA